METNYAALGRHSIFATSAGGLAVYPLWKGGVADALQSFVNIRTHLTRKLGVAAVLPDQPLELNEMDALEEAGLLVVQVPHSIQDCHAEDVAAFVEKQIDAVDSLTLSSEAQPVRQDTNASVVYGQELSTEDEHALLESINDPDADEGSI